MFERRARTQDRRRFGPAARTPVSGRSGKPAPVKDNRRVPDRRINNIQAEWLDELVIG